MNQAYVLDYVRTARGRGSARGGLHHLTPLDLVTGLQRALVERNRGLDPATVEDVVLGCASQGGEQGGNLARTANLLAGWGDRVPGVTVNRFCASGIDAVAQTSARVRGGELSLAVAGGVESVSRVPMFSDGAPLWTGAEVVRRTGGLTADELVRPDTSRAALAALPPAFAALGADGQDDLALSSRAWPDRIEHHHTIGTSPALADGAALLLIGDARAAHRLGIAPRARIVTSAAHDPVTMLTAGQDAMTEAMRRAAVLPAEVAVFEFAEAFAALCLRLRRDFDAGPDRLNPSGGTIAMGHCFGATGAIMVGGCLEELERHAGRLGVAGVSAAAGLGVALVLDRSG
ncbi:acetyl-CoA C-acyltransferase [Actinokineospora sp.]|uniref:thiolase family protein n=1 Tax=Actinokineospora sp. TaxID=1872133 RepID=UPI0040382F23